MQVNFRTLGIIPGSAGQDGEWKAPDGRRYQVPLPCLTCPWACRALRGKSQAMQWK